MWFNPITKTWNVKRGEFYFTFDSLSDATKFAFLWNLIGD